MRYINYDCRQGKCKACGQTIPVIVRVKPKDATGEEKYLFSVPEECRAAMVGSVLDVWCSQECLAAFALGAKTSLAVVAGAGRRGN